MPSRFDAVGHAYRDGLTSRPFAVRFAKRTGVLIEMTHERWAGMLNPFDALSFPEDAFPARILDMCHTRPNNYRVFMWANDHQSPDVAVERGMAPALFVCARCCGPIKEAPSESRRSGQRVPASPYCRRAMCNAALVSSYLADF
jgi:hypothetical protein